MKLIDRLRDRLVYDYRMAGKWWSTRIVTGGALFAAFAFALSMSSAGMQFMGVFGIRIALLICAMIFVGAFIGRIWRQQPAPPAKDDDDNAEHA